MRMTTRLLILEDIELNMHRPVYVQIFELRYLLYTQYINSIFWHTIIRKFYNYIVLKHAQITRCSIQENRYSEYEHLVLLRTRNSR